MRQKYLSHAYVSPGCEVRIMASAKGLFATDMFKFTLRADLAAFRKAIEFLAQFYEPSNLPIFFTHEHILVWDNASRGQISIRWILPDVVSVSAWSDHYPDNAISVGIDYPRMLIGTSSIQNGLFIMEVTGSGTKDGYSSSAEITIHDINGKKTWKSKTGEGALGVTISSVVSRLTKISKA